MLLVIDSNEFIFAFNSPAQTAPRLLLDKLLDKPESHTIRIPQTIFEEVKRNLSPEVFKEFNAFIHSITTIDEDILVPFEIGFKYESLLHLKPGDASIAAFTEWVGADALISENRHFLSRQSNLPFRVLNAESCLKTLTK